MTRFFEKLSEEAIIPTRGTKKSAGYDFHAVDGITIPPMTTKLVKTDITVHMENDEWLHLKSRSGLSFKKGIIVGAGVIDSDYYPNPIGVVIHNFSNEDFVVEKGDKIAQGIFTKYLTTTAEDEVELERTSGFGSTGK